MATSTAEINENFDASSVIELKEWMLFNSENGAYFFYNDYGMRNGFSIRKDWLNKNKRTGETISRKFVCCKECHRGSDKRDVNIKIGRAETRCGCNAHMAIRLNRKEEKFEIVSFEAEHNHLLHIASCTHMMPSQRKLSEVQAFQVDMADDSGIRLRFSYELMGKEAGGMDILGYTWSDQKNYLRTKRQWELKFGKTESLLMYFQQQSLDNPSFYYAVQMDAGEEITNIFWADAKMIIDYMLFGDVVTFDTTYKTNKEYRPLGIFVGFNHHRETVVFRATLLYDETAESFQWLFETFFEPMSGKMPKTIFTDQDAAMAKAIPLAMPDTYHRICTWHMMQNA